MGCHTIKVKGRKYFIPDCWMSVIHGEEYCNCYEFNGKKLNDKELIKELKNENKRLQTLLEEEIRQNRSNVRLVASEEKRIA